MHLNPIAVSAKQQPQTLQRLANSFHSGDEPGTKLAGKFAGLFIQIITAPEHHRAATEKGMVSDLTFNLIQSIYKDMGHMLGKIKGAVKLAKLVKILGLLPLLICIGIACPQAANDPFPVPDAIAPNVAFWKDVYTRYTTLQGVVHDNIDLSVVYGVIDLVPYNAPGANEINRNRMRAGNDKYRQILQRLARNPLDPDPECRRVARLWSHSSEARRFEIAAGRVRCQTGQKDRFEAGIVRSGAYMEAIFEILQAHGLPADIAYLPHVESSFNPNAYSKFGAAGMWQFMPATGKRFMVVDYTLDERRDPLTAAQGAARLLLENYTKLGDWPLAITAYNHGTAGMERAKRTHGDFVSIFQNYSGRAFGFASRNFYAEFIAAREAASNYRKYFGELTLDRPVPTRTVVLAQYAAFEDLSAHFQVDPQTLKQMNLALRPPVIDGHKLVPKGYVLRLPAVSGEAQLVAAIPASLYQNAQRPSRFHVVQHGDTVGKIARLHGVTVADLILANNLDRRATIYPQQTLRIHGKTDPAPSSVLVAAEKMKPATLSAKTAPKMTPSKPEATIADHGVSVSDFATLRYPAPVLASIIPLSPIEPPTESARQETMDLTQARNEQIVTVDVGFERLFQKKDRPAGIIRIAVEETLGHYADWAKVSVGQIRNLNGMGSDSTLKLHQTIAVPLHIVGAQVFEQNRYEFHKRLQEDFFAVYRIGELRPYRVLRGDNYWKLCQDKFQIPMWLLKHCNPDVDLANLRINQKLIIPIVEKASADDADPGIGTGGDNPEPEVYNENGV
jgi:membrane-bound lytic murein transglycosylase D